MTPLGQFLQKYFPVVIITVIGWTALCLGASIVYRLLKGKGFSMKANGEMHFHERFGSGHSHRSWFTRLGGAVNCILVTVTDTELLVRPWFPFNLYFMPEAYDLEHRIALDRILSVGEHQGFARAYVDIEYVRNDGLTRRISLALRNKEAFLEALKPGMKKSRGSESASTIS